MDIVVFCMTSAAKADSRAHSPRYFISDWREECTFFGSRLWSGSATRVTDCTGGGHGID